MGSGDDLREKILGRGLYDVFNEIMLLFGKFIDIFGKLKKDKAGSHMTNTFGSSLDFDSSTKPYEFGDNLENIAFNESIKNAQKNYGIENFKLAETDLETYESDQKSQTSTVLLIDISHSMILYGEDRITPAKRLPWHYLR